jgi:hypothetical protein
MPGWPGQIMMRHPDMIESTLDGATKYSIGEEIAHQQLVNYSRTQMLEHIADSDALQICTFMAMYGELTFEESLKFLLGAWLFFWYLELSERVMRTIKHGATWFDDPLYSTDLEVQNLLLRTSHPAPLSRAATAAALCAQNVSNNDVNWKVGVHTPLFVLSTIFERAWENGKGSVLKTVQNNDLAVHPKWGIEIPVDGYALGIDQRF